MKSKMPTLGLLLFFALSACASPNTEVSTIAATDEGAANCELLGDFRSKPVLAHGGHYQRLLKLMDSSSRWTDERSDIDIFRSISRKNEKNWALVLPAFPAISDYFSLTGNLPMIEKIKESAKYYEAKLAGLSRREIETSGASIWTWLSHHMQLSETWLNVWLATGREQDLREALRQANLQLELLQDFRDGEYDDFFSPNWRSTASGAVHRLRTVRVNRKLKRVFLFARSYAPELLIETINDQPLVNEKIGSLGDGTERVIQYFLDAFWDGPFEMTESPSGRTISTPDDEHRAGHIVPINEWAFLGSLHRYADTGTNVPIADHTSRLANTECLRAQTDLWRLILQVQLAFLSNHHEASTDLAQKLADQLTKTRNQFSPDFADGFLGLPRAQQMLQRLQPVSTQ